MSFVNTTALQKLSKLNKRVKIVQGGTSAGKTFNILPILYSKAVSNPGIVISVVSESIPHLRRGAIKDFLSILISTGRFHQNKWNKSLLQYTLSNGSYIEFFSADQPDRLRGARRDILYVNECNNIPFEAYNQLAIRTSKEVWVDYNPTHEFYAHTELKDDKDADFIILTYKDNEALDDSIVRELEKIRDKAKTSKYWDNWWRVYGKGEIGILEGVIFNNYKLIDNIPNQAKLIGYGLDFGYTNDPTALIEVYEYNNKRILNERLYRTGMVNNEISKYLNSSTICYADSAEPKSIEEIRRTGKMIKGVTKGRDSILFGIQVMQTQDYLVTKESTNLIKELRNYSWDKDKQGKVLNKPMDAYNHAIDAVRYHEMETIGIANDVFVF
jgi:phage terminase large subunit